MNKLDENKVYDLSELTIDELYNVWNHLRQNYESWEDYPITEMVIYQKTHMLVFGNYGWHWNDIIKPTANAKELFCTLENIQVDCSELTGEQIKEMADVFEKAGYKVGGFGMSKKVRFLLLEDGICFIGNSRDKHTITYEKFMELFGDTLVGDVIETTDEVSPISSREKELKKTLKYLLKKDIILTPKQYKKLWKKF